MAIMMRDSTLSLFAYCSTRSLLVLKTITHHATLPLRGVIVLLPFCFFGEQFVRPRHLSAPYCTFVTCA